MKSIQDYLRQMSWQELLHLAVSNMPSLYIKRFFVNSKILDAFYTTVRKEDIKRIMPDIYEELMTEKNQGYLENIIDDFFKRLSVAAVSDDIFEEIECIQGICATALWKYELPLQEKLEFFTKEFDRIDDIGERERLLTYYQTHPFICTP